MDYQRSVEQMIIRKMIMMVKNKNEHTTEQKVVAWRWMRLARKKLEGIHILEWIMYAEEYEGGGGE